MTDATAGVAQDLADESQRPGDPGRRGGITPVSLFVVLLVGYVLVQVQFILVLILVSLVLATALDRPVTLLQKRLGLHRGIVILGIYIVFFGGLYLAGFLVAPLVRDQVDIFVDEAPLRLAELRADWQASSNNLLNGTGQQLLGNAINALDNPPEPQQATAMTVLTGAIGGIIGIFATLVITFYYLMERAFIRQVLLNEVSPKIKQRVARIWDEAEAKVGGWLRGQLTLCLIIGVLSAIGYGIIGVPFWPILAIWAAITEIIPVLGPWLGGIPAVILALSVDTQTGLFALLFVVMLQMLENWVLVPRVMRGAVGLTPLTVFIAITAGAEFYGIVGTLIAIPLAAFVQVVITALLAERRLSSDVARPTRTIPAWRWMRVSSQDTEAERDGDGGDRFPSGTPGSGSNGNGSGAPLPPILGRGNRATPPQAAPPGQASPPSQAAPPAPTTTNATATEVRPETSPPLAGRSPAPTGRTTAPPGRSASPAGPAPGTQAGSAPAPRPGAQTGPRWSPEHLARNSTPPPASAPADEETDTSGSAGPSHRAIGPGETT
ncbi:MAG TPA: AI-2E family transporter [Thermomicrobiales bacterium]|nr:AI-2E family transporter [Thermomicrobiales bacterium]